MYFIYDIFFLKISWKNLIVCLACCFVCGNEEGCVFNTIALLLTGAQVCGNELKINIYNLILSTDMRRDVQEIFRMTPHEKQVMMFSATLSKEIRPVCKKFMQDVRAPPGYYHGRLLQCGGEPAT